MANSYIHSRSSAKTFGGEPEEYQALHDWFDQTKSALGDVRHRAILHNTLGIWLCEETFSLREENRRWRQLFTGWRGVVLRLLGLRVPPERPAYLEISTGRRVPIRLVAEQHVKEDTGFLPTIENWLDGLPMKKWMITGARPLSKELDREVASG